MNENNFKKLNSSISFDTDTQQSAQVNTSRSLGITSWVVTYSGGLIKNEKQANYVLIGFVVVVIVVLLFVVSSSGGESKKNTFSLDSSINVNQFAPEI